MRGSCYRPACWVFAILFLSYAFFWHSRDWNTASRLMLTYSLVDRGTVAITGLELQTGDKARVRGEYYSDKPPGYPLLATLPYAIVKTLLHLPPHPLYVDGFKYKHWAADYWVTLLTSGLLTALTAVLLALWARDLGCRPHGAALVGLAFGLSTPAYVYATLAYGHQSAAFALFGSFFLLAHTGGRREAIRVFLAGFLAAYAAVIELAVGPVSAILGFYLLAQCFFRGRRPDALALFAVGALVPTLILLLYNQLAFGSPWEMGYFYHATREFAAVHNRANPLGLIRPDVHKVLPLLVGRYRGLLFYAPILLLSIPGWAVLFARRAWGVAAVSLLSVVAIFVVNLSYPQWTGGWSTGPRLLVTLLPFALLPVAALLAGRSRPQRVATAIAICLALAGGLEMLLFQGVGARIPPYVADPLRDVVWPLWSGLSPLPDWWVGGRFCRNLVSWAAVEWIDQLPPAWQAIQFLPLVVVQGVAIVCLWRLGRSESDVRESSANEARNASSSSQARANRRW